MVRGAYALAASRQMCCADDLDLLTKYVWRVDVDGLVVQLGAGSGTMGLAILGARKDISLVTVDNDIQNLSWEHLALSNLRFKKWDRYNSWFGDSSGFGASWLWKTVDLLIVDADHSYRGAKRDLEAWGHKARTIFVHDYDGANAPRRYPGVKRACTQYFGGYPIETGGWSAVFEGKA